VERPRRADTLRAMSAWCRIINRSLRRQGKR
jgi:hypothetical protein